MCAASEKDSSMRSGALPVLWSAGTESVRCACAFTAAAARSSIPVPSSLIIVMWILLLERGLDQDPSRCRRTSVDEAEGRGITSFYGDDDQRNRHRDGFGRWCPQRWPG